MMKFLFYVFHTVIIYIVVFIDTVIFAILSSILGLINPYSKASNWSIRSWSRIILWISGIKLIIEGREHVDPSRPYIFMMNHIGMYDIPAAFIAIPQTGRFIAKKELFKIPLLATGMRLAGILKIDRGNSTEARKTLEKAITTIKDGCSIIIFPEGTRSKTNEIQPFKKGGFIMAIQGKIPILPAVICGTQYIVPKGSGLVKRGKIKIKFMPQVNTDAYAYEKRNALLKKVREMMIAEFDPTYNQKD
jgi:1-acyl-sn-glycerol-3-phosphate acyltransferase